MPTPSNVDGGDTADPVLPGPQTQVRHLAKRIHPYGDREQARVDEGTAGRHVLGGLRPVRLVVRTRPRSWSRSRRERLARALHRRRKFEWLRRYAGQSRRRDTAATWVITDAQNVVVAYASVAMTAIDRSAAPAELARQAPDPVPGLLLGRLAVDLDHANLGIGTSVVAHVLATGVELNQKAACRAVVVSALNPGARGWWERLGFHSFDPQQLDMYLMISEVEATLGRRRRR